MWHTILLTVLYIVGVASGFGAGYFWRARQERDFRRQERARLRAILASQQPGNSQRASGPHKGRHAVLSNADLSRSQAPFQPEVSRRKGTEPGR